MKIYGFRNCCQALRQACSRALAPLRNRGENSLLSPYGAFCSQSEFAGRFDEKCRFGFPSLIPIVVLLNNDEHL